MFEITFSERVRYRHTSHVQYDCRIISLHDVIRYRSTSQMTSYMTSFLRISTNKRISSLIIKNYPYLKTFTTLNVHFPQIYTIHEDVLYNNDPK